MKIEIPKILLELRRDVADANRKVGESKWERLAFKLYSFVMTRPGLYEWGSSLAPRFFPGKRDGRWLNQVPGVMSIPPVAGWLSQRDLPPPPEKSFRQLWRERNGGQS